MKSLWIKIVLLLTLLSLVTALLSDDKVSLRTNFFTDNTGTTVQSPALELMQEIVRGVHFSARYSLDRVIVPPIRGLSATPSPIDAVTGASRPVSNEDPANESFTKNRNEFIVGLGSRNLSVSYYHSDEIDYLGRMATFSANFDFNQQNSNLALSYSYGWDRIAPLGGDTLHKKQTHHLNGTITQVLSPVMVARFGGDLEVVSGLQSNPYRAVFAEGQHRLEIHPQERWRGAVFAKVNRYFTTQASFSVGYRFYRDDWQVQSHTLDFFYHQYFSDKVLIRYRYRYYNQTGAFFFRPSYPIQQAFMTSDYKLEPFTSHLFGLKIEYKLKDLFERGFLRVLSHATFEAKYERYFSSNEFTADIFQFGLVFNY